ncbi:oxygen sensor histidine kinase NreB [Geobacter sp. OR-1]|uniref:hybrid sensor histidine kinase/response regulator n=1 Tax=Geobacter sp. OR-1 TaxID=1266765 RepID=UPI000541F907|nr:response regulator [Geobacter sp. OR-1]GAM10777.1 oxygen sensor histidine kinase NreB [Geobacter sp. OR-1]
MKILIVDDNINDRNILRYTVEAHGHEAVTASDGEEGLLIAAAQTPDLVISDVLMPVMDGFQFLRSFRKTSATPFIFYSAVYEGDREMQLAAALGADAYLIKPKAPNELMAQIERIISSGIRPAPRPIVADDEYLKTYSQVLFTKLEEKVTELEHSLAEHKLTGDALRESNERLNSTLEAARIVAWEVDPFTRKHHEAGPVAELFGRGHPTLADFLAGIYPDDLERVMDALDKALRGESGFNVEYRIMHPDGDIRWIAAHGDLQYNSEGRPARLLGIAGDISMRKASEQALRDKQQRLSDLALELSMTEERERRRIATDLHDNIGQSLTLARIKLGVLAKSIPDILIDETRGLLDGVIRDVRALTHRISPPILESGSLETALKWLGRQIETDYGIMVRFSDDSSARTMPAELRSVLYHAVRELLINIAKHSQAETASLSVSCENSDYVIKVEDKGIGFDLDTIDENLAVDEGGFGLFNIRRRIHYLGGKLEITSAPGEGVRVTIRIPTGCSCQ